MDSQRDGLQASIQRVLEQVEGRTLPLTELTERALILAPQLQALCELEAVPRDLEQVALLSRLMDDPVGQVFTTLLTDRAYRSRSSKRTVEQARHLLRQVGAPSYVGPLDRIGLGALRAVGGWVPSLTGTAMLNRIRSESSAFILPDDEGLDAYLDQCLGQGISVNVNHLGEEVLGEAEAARRVAGYIALLGRGAVETMSVKASSIASQLDALAFEQSVAVLSARLAQIYRAALVHRTPDGAPKLVVLDMEAYRDVDITVSAFMRALSEPDLAKLSAGIALQTYLPETLEVFRTLANWAERRVDSGGAPIRVRLVKGANLAMERVESSLRGWRVPTLESKTLVDANFKRVLLHAGRSSKPGAVRIGLASHNLFDVCLGLVLRSSERLGDVLSFELLHGMADPLQRSLRRLGAPVLVYAPIVGEHEFPSAIAYLVRRLDENTSKDNYLRHSFGMRHGSEAWKGQETQFRTACYLAADPVPTSGRGVDRRQEVLEGDGAPFTNEADTDFSQSGNRAWIHAHLEACQTKSEAGGYDVGSWVGGARCSSGVPLVGFDPSRPEATPYRGMMSTNADVELALAAAAIAARRAPSVQERIAWLHQAALALRRGRGELIALMVLDSGKRVAEGDVEVSEAIDFANYYAWSFRELELHAHEEGAHLAPRGPTVVTPPWNFPLAIPLGGVFAGLVAGNPVILKPALETPLVAARACEMLWDAGIPRDWLQLVICEDEVASRLITDERIQTVVLTGGTATARKFLQMRPALHLLAETGGKNALYISDMSDREQAIGDVVRSAFGHAGQKCSALSQLVLHHEVYEDQTFRDALQDAVTSLVVGSAWDLSSVVTPLITPPTALQQRALTELVDEESWLVAPRFDPDNPRLVSPGVKWGVSAGSASHTTEFFCPLVSVLCARNLEDAVAIANGTSYGLTAGLHSLDEREHTYFVEHMDAGNLYLNRPITGAIVRRQPFGGWKDSSFGPGPKAGGPNYVAQFVRVDRTRRRSPTPARGVPDAGSATAVRRDGAVGVGDAVRQVLQRLEGALSRADSAAVQDHARHCAVVFASHLAEPRDVSLVHGEENTLRYRPVRDFVAYVGGEAQAQDVASVAVAAATCGCPVAWFAQAGVLSPALVSALDVRAAADGELIRALTQYLQGGRAERLLVWGGCPAALRDVANEHNVAVISREGSAVSRIELLTYLREQSVSNRFHRYGHLGLRQAL